MRDLKHVHRALDRKEPSIGNEFKVSSAVANVRQKQSQVASPASAAIADVLMDGSGQSRETKPTVIRERVKQSSKPQRVREKYRASGDSFLDRSSFVDPAFGKVTGRWLRVRHGLKKIGLMLLVCLAVWGGYKALAPVAEIFKRPIKTVTVEGEFHFISQERATELIMQEINEDFLQIDLVKIKKVLLADPWVDKVSLTRRWPDTLVVKIVEQKPIARWGNGFLNQRGEIVRVDELKGL